MKLTANMLIFALEKLPHPLFAAYGSTDPEIKHIRLLLPDEEASEEKNVIFVRGNKIFTGDGNGPTAISGTLSGMKLFDEVSDCRDALLAWDSAMGNGILDGMTASEIMDMGARFITHPYALTTHDVRVLYESSGYRSCLKALAKGIMRLGELAGSFMLRRDFHEAAQLSDCFYYYENMLDIYFYCKNILVDGTYRARLVMPLERGNERLSGGEERLFDAFSARVLQLYMRELNTSVPKAFDEIHRICRSLISGESVGYEAMSYALQRAGWGAGAGFIAGCIRFFDSPGWGAQLSSALPYLVNRVEQAFRGACAVISGESVVFVVLIGKNGMQTHEFYEKLAVFVRDNICHAGISSPFENLSELGRAARQAEAAIDLGSVRNPDSWYHRFDEYRLDYAFTVLRRESHGCLLPHPVLQKLSENDEKKDTELVKTLRAYLDSGLNMSLAADRMYIHRTSFCRRMDRIRELTGLDLNDHDKMLELEIALRLAQPLPEAQK